MSNEDQAAALAKMLAPLIAQQLASNPDLLKDVIRPAVEEQMAPLKSKNQQLLSELKGGKKPADTPKADAPKRTHDRSGQPFDRWYTQEDEDRHLAWEAEQAKRQKPDDKRPDPTRQLATGELYISREAARDPMQYRAAKERAAASGKKLVIGSPEEYADATTRNIGQPAPQGKKVATGTIDCKVMGVRYVREDLHRQGSIVQQRLAAERDGLMLRTFSSLDDLPEHLHSEVKTV